MKIWDRQSKIDLKNNTSKNQKKFRRYLNFVRKMIIFDFLKQIFL